MRQPLVSVIVPTRNSAEFLPACLESIKNQTYKNIELIVVDRDSTDDTKNIATKYADKVLNWGPERSAQRNYGVKNAKGVYVAIIDSDMELTPAVIAECVEAIHGKNVHGVIIPEESFGEGFWAQCKKLERSYYVGVDWIEAARFFRREEYLSVGGYNVGLVSGEDWDLSNRIKALGKITRVEAKIMHNEGRISLLKSLRKKAYYASHISNYISSNTGQTSASKEVGTVFRRFALYFSNPVALFRHPLVGLGMLTMKASEYGFGLIGYVRARI